ncbi:MAG: T9SS type A sorting domain-containing protein [Saprospiraceae bacterium]
MKKLLLLGLFFTLSLTTTYGQRYKEMMNDKNVNFYDVVEEAERHFENIDKGAKGSGWKNFERWRVENEHKYYPSGDRSQVDPYFVKKQYEAFLRNNPNGSQRNLYPTGWEELGPNIIDEITGHYSAGLGRVEAFYIDLSNTQKMYLGSRSGGFWRTTDGGTTWTQTTDGLVASGVDVITAAPMNSDSVLINVQNSTNGTTHGIYRSIDGGVTWVQSNFNPTNLGWGGLGTNREIYKIAYHPKVSDLIFIGTRDGLYRSTDNLQTWTVPVSGDDFTDIAFHPTNPNIVYAYAKNNDDDIYVSTDIGQTFTQVTLVGNGGAEGSITVSASCPNCVYFGSSSGIWKSTDSGTSFTFVNNPSEGRQGFAVSDLDDDNILMGYVDAAFSTDGGLNFNQVTYWSLGNTNGSGSGHQISYNTSTNYIHADLRAAECYNGVFYAATDGFLVKSADNGVTWTILSEGTGIRENYNLGVSQSNHYRTICGSQDNGTSIKHQSNWIEFTGGDGMEGLIHPLNDDWMISSYQYGSHRVIKDGGYSSSSGSVPDGKGYWITPMMYNPNNHMQIFHFSDTVHRSDDFADNWIDLGEPSFSGDIKFATIAENNSDIIVVTRNEYIELSTDGGQTFTDIQGTLPSYSITDVVFDPNDDNTIIVTYARYQNDGSKVFITHDQGATWTNITYNLGDLPVRSAIIDHTSASTIYVGTEIGVYKKAMADNTWTLYSQNLPNMSIKELDIVYGTNTIRAATWGRGLWQYTLDGRANYPAILKTEITHTPTLDLPLENVNQYVTTTIDYNNTLTSVYVEWSINAPTFGNAITMTNTTGNEWKSTSPLPNYAAGTKLFFKVFAVGDNNDTTETYKFMYDIYPLVTDFCAVITDGDNDVEQNRTTGAITDWSSDLELCSDGSTSQYIGLRFEDLNIPQGAIINNAYIEFRADENDATDLDIFIIGENADNSEAWKDDVAFDVSTRNPTSNIITWSHNSSTAWTAGVTIAQTPELKLLVQEIVNRSGWNLGNAMSFIFYDNGTETDERVADSEEGNYAPSLCIDFSMAVLPIELADFRAIAINNQYVNLEWQTFSEINNDFFTIERSKNGKEWEIVTTIKGAGNSTTSLNYSTIDPTPYTGKSYYRLKQVDFDEQFSYSDLRTVYIEKQEKATVSIFPNPTQDQISIIANATELQNIKIYNVFGQEVTNSTTITYHSNTQINVNLSNLTSGIYYVITKNSVNKVLKQ